MTTVLNTLGIIFLVIFVAIAIACIIFVVHFYVYFHCRLCKYCHHTLEFKGMKDDDEGGHALFHCPHCGAWEQVSKQDFFRDVDKGFNPHDSTIY